MDERRHPCGCPAETAEKFVARVPGPLPGEIVSTWECKGCGQTNAYHSLKGFAS